MPPRKGNGCSPQFPRDSVAAALAPPPLLKLTPHPLQGGHTLLPFHSIHRLPSKLLAQTTLSQGSSSFHACLPERHGCYKPLLETGSSRRYFCKSFPRCLIPDPRRDAGCICFFFPYIIGL